MYEVTNVRNQNELLDIYCRAFKARFGIEPILDLQSANQIAGWLIQSVGMAKARLVMDAYLKLDDDWIKEQGFPLEVLKKQINKVIVSMSQDRNSTELHVVAITQSGEPVLSTDPNALKEMGFKSIPWEKYKKKTESEDDYYH